MRVQGAKLPHMARRPETAPERLPFLEAISWYDRDPYQLPPDQMLIRYEASWRHLGVLGELSDEERAWVRYLVETY